MGIRIGLAVLLFGMVSVFAGAGAGATPARGGEAKEPPRLRLACTTFPMWMLTRNVTVGIKLFEVDLILPAGGGCPHDYEPSPQDIRRVARADALIINGLGLDDALIPPDRGRDQPLPVIDASRRDQPAWIRSGAFSVTLDAVEGARALPPAAASEWQTGPDAAEPVRARPTASHGHDHDHEHGEWNPHYFASPEEAALAAIAIARGIEEHFAEYLTLGQRQMLQDNTGRHVDELRQLARTMREDVKKLPNRRIVTHHDAFDYFARDLGLSVVGLLEPNPGVEPSPAELKRMVDAARLLGAGGVFSEPQFDAALALLAAEGIGVGHSVLDPVASGSDSAPLDHYLRTMRANLVQLNAVLGGETRP